MENNNEIASSPRNWASPTIAVVVPTYNESGNIELLYKKLATAFDKTNWEMIVVDDNSPDNTATVTKELASQFPNIRCIKRVGRRGLSSACIEGILSTAAEYVAVIDADLQHDESILPEMLRQAQNGADLVVGCRFSENRFIGEGLSPIRLWGSRLAIRLSNSIAGQSINDPMSGFFLMSRQTFEYTAPALSSEGFKILLDFVATTNRLGRKLNIVEIPYSFRPRHSGESKMSSLVAIQFLGLWFSKLTRGFLPTTFLLFALVGASGLIVHLAVLGILAETLKEPFILSQIIATLAAMTWNFFLNNNLTYADRRLKGSKMLIGLIGFYMICSLGAIANISIAQSIYEMGQRPLVAGFSGAVMSSVFNYSVTKLVTWR